MKKGTRITTVANGGNGRKVNQDVMPMVEVNKVTEVEQAAPLVQNQETEAAAAAGNGVANGNNQTVAIVDVANNGQVHEETHL